MPRLSWQPLSLACSRCDSPAPLPLLPPSPLLLCPRRVTGEVSGFYFDPTSSPDQQLRLAAVRAGAAGFAFPAFELA